LGFGNDPFVSGPLEVRRGTGLISIARSGAVFIDDLLGRTVYRPDVTPPRKPFIF